MERRDEDEPKIYRPQKHGRKWRVAVDTGNRRGGATRTRRYRSFATESAALAYVAAARDETQGRTVKGAIEAFLARKVELGRSAATIESYEDRLELLLGPVRERHLRSIAGRGEELYAAAQADRAADTHRNALAVAKMWGRWCVKQRWLRADPFADVEPTGARTFGADKSQLTVDEARQLDAWCRARGDDPDAVITLAYLLLGARASELVRRDVRDLDDGGRLLRIGRTKSRAGRRQLAIPPQLTLLLVGLSAGRPPDAPLFSHPDGTRWSRHVAYGRVRRVCKAAGVPVLPPQALRRTQSTLATEAGETAIAVARHLGHDVAPAPAVTHRAYVSPDAARNAGVDRGLRVLQGGQR